MSSTSVSPEKKAPSSFDLRQLLRQDIGQLPVIVALIALAIYFEIDSNQLFLTPRNLSNLILQIAEIGTVSLAAVLVLLIGEIDLSLAAVSSLCGAVMVTLSVQHHFSAFTAILAALIVGAIVGAINGVIVAIVRVPSFIVTLAALIGYSGLLLHILLPNTTIRLNDEVLTGITSNYLPGWLGFLLPLLAIAVYIGLTALNYISRQRRGLAVQPLWQIGVRIAVVLVITIAAFYEFYSYLGVPYVAVILLGLVILFWLLLRFTTFGRHVYAVGGNAEAARRAGINVIGIRIIIFSLASTLAAVAGILESSRTISASAQVSPDLLLNAIAAAVIGGVSLFGGRGSVWAVILGSLVIGGLLNGLVLQGRTTDIQQMVEAAVLILAVIIDAVLRRRNAVTGR